MGYGESRAVADNATDAGRDANRRIEFTLIGGTPASAGQAAAAPPADGTAAAPAAEAAGEPGPGAEKSELAPADNDVQPKPRPKQ